MADAFLNGDILDEASAAVSANDRGLLLGDGVFETLRAYGGTVFRLGAHLARLRDSAEFLRLPFGHSDEEIESAIAELLRRNDCPDAYVRVTVTRGTGAKGLRLDGDVTPTVLIQARTLQEYPPELYRHGVRLIVSKLSQNSGSPLPRHKTLSYLLYLLARQEAVDASAHGAILLNEKGQVTEEAAANLFLVRGGEIVTPPVHCGLLPGITRAAVVELAGAHGIPLHERSAAAGELFESDEVFLTNTLMEVLPVRSVDRRPVGTRTPGPVTERIRALYRQAVRDETT